MARNIATSNQLNLGDIVYNDVHFPAATASSVRMEPVYDRSERGLMYVKYAIRVEFIVHLQDLDTIMPSSQYFLSGDSWESNNPTRNSGQVSQGSEYTHTTSQPGTTGDPGQKIGRGIDHTMAYLRRRLLQPGRELLFSGLGLGPDLNINQIPYDPDRGLMDVAWGPKPRLLNWEPLGSNSAARVVWECEVGLVECEDIESWSKERMPLNFHDPNTGSARTFPVEILEVVYNETWDINPEGLTTKTYDAIIKIRGYVDTQGASRHDLSYYTNVIKSADQYRLWFEPKLQKGFKRSRRYRLNDDKTELAVTITDAEIDSDWAYPPGVTKLACDYTIKSKLAGDANTLSHGAAFKNWKATLSGSMTLAKGAHPLYRKRYPYYIMLSIIRSRFFLNQWNDEVASADGSMSSGHGGSSNQIKSLHNKVENVPLSFSMTEDIFGREFSFNFSWVSLELNPSAAPWALRFGYSPNLWAEHQQVSTAPLNKAENPNMLWDWNDWIHSVIGAQQATTADRINYPGRMYMYQISVPSSDAMSNAPQLATLYMSWGSQGAPMSMRGAAWAGGEGDTRMEPCQDNQFPNAWYSSYPPPSFSPYDGVITSDIFRKRTNTYNKIVDFDCDVKILEENQVIQYAPLNSPEKPTLLTDNVDGLSTANTTFGNVPVLNGVKGRVITPTNKLGDTSSTYDPVQQRYTPTDIQAPKVQCIGPGKYTLRLVGRVLCVGKPANPPRVSEWGEAIAVRKRNETSVKQVESGGIELWETSFVQEYALLGTPNGVSAYNDGDVSPIFSDKHTATLATRGV